MSRLNPHQAKKVDIAALSPEEQRLFRLYGKLPSKSDHFAKHLKERKYFDSGDYALSKAGKGDSVDAGAVGDQHPVPENIPHLSSPVTGQGGPFGRDKFPSIPGGAQAGSPVKESSFLNRETSADEVDKENENDNDNADGIPGGPNPSSVEPQGLPIRR